MRLKRFMRDGLLEARRQLFGIPIRKPKTYQYLLTLSEPVLTSLIIGELLKTDIDQYVLSLEDISNSRYRSKYRITRKRKT